LAHRGVPDRADIDNHYSDRFDGLVQTLLNLKMHTEKILALRLMLTACLLLLTLFCTLVGFSLGSYFSFCILLFLIFSKSISPFSIASLLVLSVSNYLLVVAGFFESAFTGIDSQKYYLFAKNFKSFSALYDDYLHTGGLLIVQSFGSIMALISLLIGDSDLYITTSLNVIFCYLGALVFAETSTQFLSLSKRTKIAIFLLIFFSPIIGQNLFGFNKDILSFSLTIFCASILSSFLSKKHKRYSLLIIFIPLAIFCTMLRPYNPIFILAYIYIWGIIKTRTIIFLMIACTATGFYIGSITYFRDFFLVFLSFFTSPNFLRSDNWINHPFSTAESLLIFVSCFFVFLFTYKTKFYKRIFIALSLCALILAVVTVNRLFNDITYVMTGLLADDISRKKISVMPIIYLFILIGLKSARKTNLDFINYK